MVMKQKTTYFNKQHTLPDKKSKWKQHKCLRLCQELSCHYLTLKDSPSDNNQFSFFFLLMFLLFCLSQLFDEKIKECKEDESRRVSTSSAALSLCVSALRSAVLTDITADQRATGGRPTHSAGKQKWYVSVWCRQMISVTVSSCICSEITCFFKKGFKNGKTIH